ncbi:MAG: two-component system response regulator [Chloroflexi bacterium HGW-Chloroflexi-2]|jgi:CheY-like chemotaxis protein|nr:MAG: two-component system response regulator [Chloroflexi bacterium HGW-Chloroflexi-2]
MKTTQNKKIILMVEDDPDDIYLIGEAIDECQMNAQIFIVEDGEQMLDYLHQRGDYSDPDLAPRPDLILLDLNMPRKDGREALVELKEDPDLRGIPVVVLTTSSAERDMKYSYEQGASGFVTKPVSFSGLREAVCKIGDYWIRTVQLPEDKAGDEAEGNPEEVE